MRLFGVLFLLLLSLQVHAKTVLRNISFEKVGGLARVVLHFEGEMTSAPEVTTKGNSIALELPDTYVLKTLEKYVEIYKAQDTRLGVYQLDKEKSRLDVELPYSLASDTSTPVTIKNNTLSVEFPIEGKVALQNTTVKKTVTKNASPTKANNSDNYDEKFLKELLEDKKQATKNANQLNVLPIKNEEIKTNDKIEELEKKLLENDEVKMKTSSKEIATHKDTDKTFSTLKYLFKFAGFLLLVLALFYGIVWALKKGVFSKSKFNFLGSGTAITVLNTTFIGPKRSLMLVKVYNQVFLLGSSESGISILSEINDVPGLLKAGEKEIGGSNFDTNFDSADLKNEEVLQEAVKLKENITISTPDNAHVGKFSEQIKNKIKNLRQFQ